MTPKEVSGGYEVYMKKDEPKMVPQDVEEFRAEVVCGWVR